MVGDELERELFVLRKTVEAEKDAKLPAERAFDFYTCSLSNKTIIYKVPMGTCTYAYTHAHRCRRTHMLMHTYAHAHRSTRTHANIYTHSRTGHASLRGGGLLFHGPGEPRL